MQIKIYTAIALTLSAFTLLGLLWMGRYEVIKTEPAIVMLMDRWTGRPVMCAYKSGDDGTLPDYACGPQKKPEKYYIDLGEGLGERRYAEFSATTPVASARQQLCDYNAAYCQPGGPEALREAEKRAVRKLIQ